VSAVEEINRGLERAGQAHAANREPQLNEEFGRNRIKAEEFLRKLEPRFDNRSLFDVAQTALFRLEGSLKDP